MWDLEKVTIALVALLIYTIIVSAVSYSAGESDATIECYEEKMGKSK